MSGLQNHQADREPRVGDWKVTPTRVTVVYLVFGACLLALSEILLAAVASGEQAPLVQAVRSAVQIGGTAGFVYVLAARGRSSVSKANEDLAVARQGLSVLNRLFRHNLRNDLTVVAGHAEQLEAEVEEPSVATHCDAIYDRCDELITRTEKVKLAAELNRQDVSHTAVDLPTTIASVEARFAGLDRDVELVSTVPDDAAVLAHEYIEYAILEVVENAVIHHDDASPTVEISTRASPEYSGWVELVVADDGPGIPRTELEAVDETADPLEHGSGVGLWMASWIVYRSGGDFDIENTDAGCRVTIALPRPDVASTQQTRATLQRFLA